MNKIEVEKKVLSANDRTAELLRRAFSEYGVLCLNLISSPGAGKTTLLERTLASVAGNTRLAVLTGDVQTDADARRLAQYGFPVKQITTGGGCHLTAGLVEHALQGWSLADLDILFIENVGNLICPAAYDLGESAKIVLLSVTEGDEKPLKYPAIFSRAALMVLTKVDLLAYVPFQAGRAIANARSVNPRLETIELSCMSDHGLADWERWLAARHPRLQFAEPLLV
ncbi:MAG TPA: hydrogenase nickel incorporation protein HypB [Terriglobales bacterium]|jgi:hydrogenase nickel incorporation protein HypB|nr:hydrogenase nickel incorporation protein HypB [Terriglobales bacterium]